MTIEQRKKLAAHLQRLLKVRRVSFPIAQTEKGPLNLTYTKDAQDFEIVLDAVPLNMNDYDNRELKSLLEKYLFEKESNLMVYKHASIGPSSVDLLAAPSDSSPIDDAILNTENTPIRDMPAIIENLPEKKKRGRPAKNK